MSHADNKIDIRNIVSPGHIYRVDRSNYDAMRTAHPAVLPEALFPGGAKAGW